MFGMQINEKKSQFMSFNANNIERLEGIDRANEVKYLGVTFSVSANSTENHIRKKLTNAHKYKYWANQALANNKCRVFLGKTIWKQMFLPSLIHGFSAITLNKGDIKELDTIQYQYMRTIANMPKRTRQMNSYRPKLVIPTQHTVTCFQNQRVYFSVKRRISVNFGRNSTISEIRAYP